MSLHSLPVFLRLAGRPVILVGDGEAAAAKRRLLERAGAAVVGEDEVAALAIITTEDAEPIAARLKARGVLVNVADRPDLCDFTLPAIVDRMPVIVAIGTGGASAGLAAALRQRLETMLPAGLGKLANALHEARDHLRAKFPDAGERRRALSVALARGGELDPFRPDPDLPSWLAADRPRDRKTASTRRIWLASVDPDDLTLREARWLAMADRVVHADDVPAAVLDRARADAVRVASGAPAVADPQGLTVILEMAR